MALEPALPSFLLSRSPLRMYVCACLCLFLRRFSSYDNYNLLILLDQISLICFKPLWYWDLSLCLIVVTRRTDAPPPASRGTSSLPGAAALSARFVPCSVRGQNSRGSCGEDRGEGGGKNWCVLECARSFEVPKRIFCFLSCADPGGGERF